MEDVFFTLSESANELSLDVKELLEILAGELDSALPMYLRADGGFLLAKLNGVHGADDQGTIAFDNGSSIRAGRTPSVDLSAAHTRGEYVYADLGDQHCEVRFARSYHGCVFVALNGFFRIFRTKVKEAIRTNSFLGSSVAPGSWWRTNPIVPQRSVGGPGWSLSVLVANSRTLNGVKCLNDLDWVDPPRFSDAFFLASDVERFKASLAPRADIGARERHTFLRIIDALSVMAKLKERGAASPIAAQLAKLGYQGPTDDTIREVLKQASKLRPKK